MNDVRQAIIEYNKQINILPPNIIEIYVNGFVGSKFFKIIKK